MIRTDLVMAMTDPPFQGIVGAFVAWLKRKPFVYNIRDLYPEMALVGNIVRPSWWVRLWERLHRWALGRASRVIVLGEDTRERIIAKGIDPARVVVVRDGAHARTAGCSGRTIRSPRRFAAVFLLWCFMPVTWAFMELGKRSLRRPKCWITKRWVLSLWVRVRFVPRWKPPPRAIGKIKFHALPSS